MNQLHLELKHISQIPLINFSNDWQHQSMSVIIHFSNMSLTFMFIFLSLLIKRIIYQIKQRYKIKVFSNYFNVLY